MKAKLEETIICHVRFDTVDLISQVHILFVVYQYHCEYFMFCRFLFFYIYLICSVLWSYSLCLRKSTLKRKVDLLYGVALAHDNLPAKFTLNRTKLAYSEVNLFRLRYSQ